MALWRHFFYQLFTAKKNIRPMTGRSGYWNFFDLSLNCILDDTLWILLRLASPFRKITSANIRLKKISRFSVS